MIKGFQLDETLVNFIDRVESWEEAIRISAKPLVEQDYVSKAYVSAMIDSVNEHGPYICIAPDIALPHARPEAGSKKIGFSVLRVKEPVVFSEAVEHHSKVLITLSCVNAETHLEMLRNIVMTLSDEAKNVALFKATNASEIVAIFNS